MKSNYYEKKENRIQKYFELAEKNRKLSTQLSKMGSDMAKSIPFGQPILLGHHSERHDRRFRASIQNKFEKSARATDKGNYYLEKAKAAENNSSISSDNPDAIKLLREKVAKLQHLQEKMVAANKCIRKNNKEGLSELGFSEKEITGLFTPDCFGIPGFAPFELSNNRQKLNNAKKRLVMLEKQAKEESSEREYTAFGLRIVDNVEENRTQLFFDEKPSAEIRTKLKGYGFRWCRSLGCWQRLRNRNTNFALKCFIEELNKI